MQLKIVKTRARCRVGLILVDDKQVETPSCLVYTRAGTVPHVVLDLLENMGNCPSAVQLTLPTLTDQPNEDVIKEQGKGINTFLGLEGFISLLSVQDPAVKLPSGYNEDKSVSVWNAGGRRKINIQQFTSTVHAFKPNIVECLCDTIPAEDQTAKRIKKSVDRTLKFLDEMIKYKDENKDLNCCHLFGVIEGSDSLEERLRSAQETANHHVAGFVLEGFDAGACEWVNLLQKTVEVLPSSKPRVLQGIGTPDDVIQAVECGIDLFDSSFPYLVTERGCAIVFQSPNKRLKPELNYDNQTVIKGISDSTGSAAERTDDALKSTAEPTAVECTRSGNNNETQKRVDDPRVDDHDKGLKTQSTEYEIDLNDTRYSADMSAIVTGCTCYCCTNHTRAYVHHLLVTKEMLAQVLLMIHNMHQYFQFFRDMREALSSDSWEELKDRYQTNHRLST